MSRAAFEEAAAAGPEDRFSAVGVPIALGLAFNLAALAIGNPYQMGALGLALGLIAALVWSGRPLSWIVFAALLAASPANNTTPVALNLLVAGTCLLLMRGGGWHALPRPAQMGFAFALLSMLISVVASLGADLKVPSIHAADASLSRSYLSTWAGGFSTEAISTQLLSVVNYLFGPFLLIPLAFSRMRADHDPRLLLKGLLFGLVMPTLVVFVLTMMFGKPVRDVATVSDSLLNVSTFRLWKLEILMIRTQVGIILAALICASFAICISHVSRGMRFAALVCLIVAAYFLLITGSVGSTLAAVGGILLTLVLGSRHLSIRRYLAFLVLAPALLVGTWTVLPQDMQQYAESRYIVRVGKGSSSTADRAWRWKKSFNYLMDNPSGVGWSLYVDPLKIYPHNDYLSYGIAFGVLCGLIYLLYPMGFLFSFMTFDAEPMNPDRFAMALAGVGVTAAMFINSMSDHMTSNRWYFNVVWSLMWYSFFASRAGSRAATSKSV